MVIHVLIFVELFAMLTLGYQFGVYGRMSLGVVVLLAICFAAVMWLIFALDHPEAGLIKVNQTPFITLQEQLHQRR